MNCDRIARWYAFLEHAAFGSALERCRFRFLPEIANARRILTLGDGDGRALAALLNACPQAHIDCVDVSAEMLAVAQKRIGHNPRVTFLHADALTMLLPDHAYDAVVMHFFLDCFEDTTARVLIDRLTKATEPGARWIVSEFRADQAWSRGFVSGLYLFFRATTELKTRCLPNYPSLFQQTGLALVKREISTGGLLTSELWRRP